MNCAVRAVAHDAIDLLEERVSLVVIIALAPGFQAAPQVESCPLDNSLSHSLSHHFISSLAS
jgi:hypothetical protein